MKRIHMYLHVCMYECMYVCMYVCMHACAYYTCMLAYILVHVCGAYVCACAYVSQFMNSCVYPYVCLFMGHVFVRALAHLV